MKARLLLPMMIALAATIASGQSECPTINVTGPAGIIDPGEVIGFSGEVSGAKSDGLTYLWYINGGEFVSGQRTLSPKIKPKGFWEIQMIVTLEVKGLPQGCPDTASETFAQACSCQPIFSDEFSISPKKIDTRRLDVLVESLAKYPDATIFIIEYFRPRTTQAVVTKKLELVRKYLVDKKGLKSSDFEIVTEAIYCDNRELTKFYIVPPGADKPTP